MNCLVSRFHDTLDECFQEWSPEGLAGSMILWMNAFKNGALKGSQMSGPPPTCSREHTHREGMGYGMRDGQSCSRGHKDVGRMALGAFPSPLGRQKKARKDSNERLSRARSQRAQTGSIRFQQSFWESDLRYKVACLTCLTPDLAHRVVCIGAKKPMPNG